MSLVFPEPRFIDSSGVRLAVYEAHPENAAQEIPVVFLHGFPELAFSWRHQLPAFAKAGWRAIAFDGRGYGNSDALADTADYHMRHLTADVEAVLDAHDIKRAIFVGHDWGALTLWSLPFYCPDRIAGLVGLNVPFKPRRAEAGPVTMMRKVFGEDYYYVFFQTPEKPEALLEADPARTMRFFMRRATPGKKKSGTALDTKGFALQKLLARPEADWPGEVFLTPAELEYYAAAFAQKGFTGPLGWYRNTRANWEDMARFQSEGSPPQLDWPVLMIMAADDPVLPPALADDIDDFCPDVESRVVAGSGHWTQQEKPDQVNALILDWLARRFA